MAASVDWTKPEDFKVLGKPAPFRVIALTGRNDQGDIIGIGGIALLPDGQRLAFADLTEEARSHPVALHKTALKLLEVARKRGIRRIVASADLCASPAAIRWLLRLGFTEHDYNGTPVYIWRP